MGVLADNGLSSSSPKGGFTLGALGEATTGVLGFAEMGVSSSSPCVDTFTGANLGDVAFRGEVAWSISCWAMWRKDVFSGRRYSLSIHKVGVTVFSYLRTAVSRWRAARLKRGWRGERKSQQGHAKQRAAATRLRKIKYMHRKAVEKTSKLRPRIEESLRTAAWPAKPVCHTNTR